MNFIRSIIFNILFYTLNIAACILCIPGLLLPPDKALSWIVRNYVRGIYILEKYIMGLDFEIRGIENIPKKGAYIIAAKHQSAYETFKLHLLFDDPAIVLKQELLRVPIWGKFLKKVDPIAIDRSKGKDAIAQIIEGAKKVKAQNRPLIIFPQGTRVFVEQTPKDKPYKIGVARIAEATNMPIVPLALNTGYFWPRKGLMKKSGKVVFEFLPPIKPDEYGVYEIIKMLETQIEEHSIALLPAPKRKALENKAAKTTD